MPSIIAGLVVALASFVLVRRRHPAPVAFLAMALCLVGGLYPFALDARPYACVSACFALALVLWDLPPDRDPPPWRAVLMLLLLVAAVGLHFYAVLLAASVGAMELAWTAAHRRIRFLYLAAPAVACLSVLLWLPIMRHVLAFNRGDVAAPEFYGRPLPARLVLAYVEVMVGHRPVWVSPMILLLLVLIARRIIAARAKVSPPQPRRAPDNLDIIAAVTCALPLAGYLVTLVAVHTFNTRYVIAAALGFAILIARYVASLPRAPLLCCALLVISAGLMIMPDTWAASARQRERVLALVRAAPPGLSIATGNGLRFLEIREGAGAAIARRLVFVKAPPGIASPDPTNQHILERWKTVLPDLPVVSTGAFMRAHRRFLVFSDESAVDLLPAWLAQHGYRLDILARAGDAWLSEAQEGAASERLSRAR
ncbi:MAG TPA: hypothetical protein VMF62_20430, partial [Acetobacteraceae bacterium]|nr:hypothetical protein [Acetobacteraceae bacterium]